MDFKKIKKRLITLFCAAAVIIGGIKYLSKPKAGELEDYITFYSTDDNTGSQGTVTEKSDDDKKESNNIVKEDETKDEKVTENGQSEKQNETDSRISINNASLEELMTLPGIGQSKAQKIIDYRNQFGGFVSIEELTEVNGIGEKTLEKLKPLIKL